MDRISRAAMDGATNDRTEGFRTKRNSSKNPITTIAIDMPIPRTENNKIFMFLKNLLKKYNFSRLQTSILDSWQIIRLTKNELCPVNKISSCRSKFAVVLFLNLKFGESYWKYLLATKNIFETGT